MGPVFFSLRPIFANQSAPRLTMWGTQARVSTLLTIVGAAEDPADRGERRLDARLAALALEALDQPRLLAADVRARAAVDVDVERRSRCRGCSRRGSPSA